MFARNARIALAAALMTVSFGTASLLPMQTAEAGSVTLKISPKGKQAKKLQKGLQILSIIQNAKNVAKVKQNGDGNAVGLGQSGGGNVVGVFQDGSGHTATATQSGGNNALGIIQLGKNTNADVSQLGGETGIIIQGGW